MAVTVRSERGRVDEMNCPSLNSWGSQQLTERRDRSINHRSIRPTGKENWKWVSRARREKLMEGSWEASGLRQTLSKDVETSITTTDSLIVANRGRPDISHSKKNVTSWSSTAETRLVIRKKIMRREKRFKDFQNNWSENYRTKVRQGLVCLSFFFRDVLDWCMSAMAKEKLWSWGRGEIY